MLGPVDLFVDLRRDHGGPLRHRLERELRTAVQTGRLLPGAALPSTRAFAEQLGVSRGVVVEAYAQLAAEGYLSARQGAGTMVAERARAGAARISAPAGTVTPAPAPRYDFRYGVPDLSAFPRAAWLAATARSLRELPDADLGYGDPCGSMRLREALAGYLGRARGVIADPALLLISGGTRQGMGLVWRVLRDAGVRRVAVEDPGWPAQHETARDAGLQAVPVAVDDRGLRVDDLRKLDVGAVALTPAHQFPGGALLAPERRTALLEWARRTDAIVIEDDYDAEYRYDRDPVGALQGMAPDRVVYAGSASKTLAPALRTGWLLMPAQLAGATAPRKAIVDRGHAAVTQLALADLIESGELDRHLRRTRRSYRARRDALVAAVARELPGARVEGIAAGLHAVVRLPPGVAEEPAVRAAAERGVALDGLGSFGDGGSPALVLGYANLPAAAIARGIAELAAVVR